MGRIVFIRQVVERQVFAEMSTAARDVGLVWIMIVQGIVTGALHILVKKQKGHHLYAIHAVKRIRRTKIFYCDPQASWQKPHIEKNHEFIRYVIPRGKTFKGYTQEDMTLISNHINITTRPGLEYKSPYDLVETEEMKKLLEVLNMSPVAADEICLRPKLLSKE